MHLQQRTRARVHRSTAIEEGGGADALPWRDSVMHETS